MNITHPIHGSIEFNELLSALINTPEMNRLKRINQMGLASLVFPGATHTRFLHALGVCHLSGRIADKLDLSGQEKDTIQAAALLHDVGHGPFSHTLESLAPKGMQHEEKGRDIIVGKKKMNLPGAGNIPRILSRFNMDKKVVAALVTGTYKAKPYLQQIINGPIDADKMDYLLTDAHFTGVKIGIIDVDRILDVMVIEQNQILFLEKGKPSIKALRTARSNMFAEVYIHHTSRIAEKMLTKAVKLSGIGSQYDYDDFQLMAILEQSNNTRVRELIQRIIYNVNAVGTNGRRNLYKVAYQIKSTSLSKQKKILVQKLKKIGEERIEQLLLGKLAMKPGEILVDFPEIYPQHVEQEFKELGIAFQSSEGKSNYSLFSVYCTKEHMEAVAKTTIAFIKEAKKKHLSSSWIKKF